MFTFDSTTFYKAPGIVLRIGYGLGLPLPWHNSACSPCPGIVRACPCPGIIRPAPPALASFGLAPCPAIIRPALAQVKSYPRWTMLSSIQPYVNTFGSRDRWLEVYLCTNNSQIYLNQETHLWLPRDLMYVGDVRALRGECNYYLLFLCFVFCF